MGATGETSGVFSSGPGFARRGGYADLGVDDGGVWLCAAVALCRNGILANCAAKAFFTP